MYEVLLEVMDLWWFGEEEGGSGDGYVSRRRSR